jgi:FkbM family methyltransferase
MFSNTYLFARHGASGICFEPSKSTYWKLRLFHCLHPKVRCVNEGISESEARLSFVSEGYEGLTSFLSEPANGASDHDSVTVRPLSYWIQRWPRFRSVDFVSIDTEGHELSVLRGIDFQTFSTKCFIIETDKTSSHEIEEILKKAGYQARLTNGLNTFYFADGFAPKTEFAEIAARFQGYQVI